jgi:hypothetical protein
MVPCRLLTYATRYRRALPISRSGQAAVCSNLTVGHLVVDLETCLHGRSRLSHECQSPHLNRKVVPASFEVVMGWFSFWKDINFWYDGKFSVYIPKEDKLQGAVDVLEKSHSSSHGFRFKTRLVTQATHES